MAPGVVPYGHGTIKRGTQMLMALVVFQVHVNLMVLEARMQAELLYALRVVMRYMT